MKLIVISRFDKDVGHYVDVFRSMYRSDDLFGFYYDPTFLLVVKVNGSEVFSCRSGGVAFEFDEVLGLYSIFIA